MDKKKRAALRRLFIKIRNNAAPLVQESKPCEEEQKEESAFSSARAFEKALLKRGFERLGSGAYSVVLAKPGYDRVLKVTRTQDNWIDYVKWASASGYAGNFAPKVFSWKRFNVSENEEESWKSRSWSVSVVERMKETLDSKSAIAQDFKVFESLHYLVGSGNVMAQLYCEDLLPGSSKFFADLHKNFYASDIYSKNLMVREDGSFCVTDPVCGSSKLRETRIRARDFVPAVNIWRGICDLLKVYS